MGSVCLLFRCCCRFFFFVEHAGTDFTPWELFCFDMRTVSDNKHCGFVFHSSAKECAKTRTNFEMKFAKNEIYLGQVASVFSGKVRLKTSVCRSSGISGLYLQPVTDLLKSDCDC